jgi:hypothetical protein
MVRVMRVSKRPAARAPLPRREQPVTPTLVGSISGKVVLRASRVRWKPQAQAVRTPVCYSWLRIQVRHSSESVQLQS